MFKYLKTSGFYVSIKLYIRRLVPGCFDKVTLWFKPVKLPSASQNSDSVYCRNNWM